MKFENTEVFNFLGALRGMRNPLESHSKLDSYPITYDGKNACRYEGQVVGFHIGENDLKLAQKLVLAGNEHSKFMRQIFVSVDITAPLYWWKEMDQYRIGITTNSNSTMHKLSTTNININCFEVTDAKYDNLFLNFVNHLEALRVRYLETKDIQIWRMLIQELPESWLQTRTITMSYANLRNIYFQRKNHKLTEWSVDFIVWINSLPYAKELIMLEEI
jgi:hypothetical protein